MRNFRKRSNRFPNPLKVEVNNPMAFRRDGRLHALASSVHVRRDIEQIVSRHLEPAIRDHLHAVGFKDDALTLNFDSAAFSARLRYRTDDLSRNLRKHPELAHLKTIRCIVRPPVPLQLGRRTSMPPRQISRQTADMLHDSIKNFSDYEIRESLQRLADLASRKK